MLSITQVYLVSFPVSFVMNVDDSFDINSVTMEETNTEIVWDPPLSQRLSPSQVQVISTPRSADPVESFQKKKPTVHGGNGNLTITVNFQDGNSDSESFPTFYLNIFS